MGDQCQPGLCGVCASDGPKPQRRIRWPLSDNQLFSLLVARHSRAVRVYAQALTSAPWVVDEVTQTTFIRAWKYLDSFRGKGCFEGWLLRICRNAVVDHYAKKPTTTSNVFPLARGNGSEIEVVDLMRSLPVAQREVMVLCGPLGYSYEAAAAILEIPVGTVRSRLARGRDRLSALVSEANSA